MRPHRVLFDENSIATRVRELARIIGDQAPQRDLVVVGLLTGSFIFVADLVRAATPLGIEPRVDFMATSHYGDSTIPSRRVEILRDVTLDIRGRAVLLVDDILDTGVTLLRACEHLAARGPTWLHTCVLLDKPMRRLVQIDADYVGFTVPDCWVIGYGLDIAGEGRGLPYIGALDSDVVEQPKNPRR
jgi:hypoxanthine phosphoribosyltransferase